jgi:xanthine dehydrogenase accessory factor
MNNILIVIRGGGDLATGVAVRIFRAGFSVLVLEVDHPTVIRLPVSFARVVYEGKAIVEGIEAVLIPSWEEVEKIIKLNKVPVLVDPEGSCIKKLSPTILVDAILAKRNLGTRINQAPLVIGLGPGFTAGEDVDVVVETMRGHNLGIVYYQGQAAPDTGVPGEVGGESKKRLLRAPAEGKIVPLHKIGDMVKAGEAIAEVEGVPLKAEISGVLRGLIYPIREYCFTVSDKARSIGGAVLEAICVYMNKK